MVLCQQAIQRIIILMIRIRINSNDRPMVRPATYCDLLQNPRFVYIPTMNFKNDFKRLFKMCFLNLSSKYHTPHSTRFFLYTQYYTIDMFFLHIKDPFFWKNSFLKGIS